MVAEIVEVVAVHALVLKQILCHGFERVAVLFEQRLAAAGGFVEDALDLLVD